ncbi:MULTISPECIES: hypothetical protein [unclassified Lentimonas]|uniref:hypothetical protein n=1 Tax=unclassified Lentimonas TaxID=2630993 RepID=UPI00132B5E57|nr:MULTISPECIES: hypothetical protein [unclassified Lentimonas]CAA6692934.1 Unannotated [Lentimonas sp. CC10]CAA6695602.1 Unannotated [Lentimonas sp. CC19]CAA7069930.1 Unannotated [Lentimonas sp. CC11]
MKLRNITSCFVFSAYALCLSLVADETKPEVSAVEIVIPTEISEPPYEVGELPSTQGYYIERDDQTAINFRIVGNRMRVYWIDENGLIAEPESTGGSVRLKGQPKIRDFFGLSPVSGDAGLGSAGIVKPPHLFTVYLSLEQADSKELVTHSFRYTIAMDTPEPNADSAN